AFGPAALALNSLLHRSPWKQHGAAGESLRAQLAERADIVDDPDSAPVGGQHHVVVALLKRDVAYRQAGGEIVRLELRPALPAVEAHVEPELGPEEQDVWVEPVLLDHMGIAANAGRVGADQLLPGAAVIGRAIEVGSHVANGVAVVGDVGDSGIVAARFD